eukprot:GHVH01004697.1.p1 GENE.GHVH01004697.1~~GHVH01004697.1.p1  ORF type:complete len:443 (+),score=36.14 GHVH01004697.1:567-1895(+)
MELTSVSRSNIDLLMESSPRSSDHEHADVNDGTPVPRRSDLQYMNTDDGMGALKPQNDLLSEGYSRTFTLSIILPKRSDKWFENYRAACSPMCHVTHQQYNSAVDGTQHSIWDVSGSDVLSIVKCIEKLATGIPRINFPSQCVGRTVEKKVSFRLLIPSKLAYRIIGVGGQTIQLMRNRLHCDVFVSPTLCRHARILCLVSGMHGLSTLNSALKLAAYAAKLVSGSKMHDSIYRDAQFCLSDVEFRVFQVISKSREEQEQMNGVGRDNAPIPSLPQRRLPDLHNILIPQLAGYPSLPPCQSSSFGDFDPLWRTSGSGSMFDDSRNHFMPNDHMIPDLERMGSMPFWPPGDSFSRSVSGFHDSGYHESTGISRMMSSSAIPMPPINALPRQDSFDSNRLSGDLSQHLQRSGSYAKDAYLMPIMPASSPTSPPSPSTFAYTPRR